MKTIEVEALTDQHNYAVFRLPARQFPGIVVQGDSLSTFVADLRRGLDLIRRGDTPDGVGEVEAVLASLEGVQRTLSRRTRSRCRTSAERQSCARA